MKLDYKSWIIIILIGIIVISFFITGFSTSENNAKFEKKIDALEDSIQRKEHKIEFLQMHERSLIDQIIVRDLEIESLKKNINKLKKRNNEKVDSVYRLNNQRTFDYITNYLSKRGSIKR